MNSVCRRPSVGSKLCAIMLSELCALCERKTSPHTFPIFFFSQKNTEEQISQRPTETLSQPITQSVTANISYKVCAICRLPADVCGFSLFAERFLFICENLWERKYPTGFLCSKNLWETKSSMGFSCVCISKYSTYLYTKVRKQNWGYTSPFIHTNIKVG